MEMMASIPPALPQQKLHHILSLSSAGLSNFPVCQLTRPDLTGPVCAEFPGWPRVTVTQSAGPTRTALLINNQTGGGKAQFDPNQDQDRNNRRTEGKLRLHRVEFVLSLSMIQ